MLRVKIIEIKVKDKLPYHNMKNTTRFCEENSQNLQT